MPEIESRKRSRAENLLERMPSFQNEELIRVSEQRKTAKESKEIDLEMTGTTVIFPKVEKLYPRLTKQQSDG